jgi:E3 ubiquitin-protein ligase makorin
VEGGGGGAAGIADHLTACAREHPALMIEPKECGICMENVYDKPDARFGLLSTHGTTKALEAKGVLTRWWRCGYIDCEHCFCLECIRRWRTQVAVHTDAAHGCPQCRVVTHFIVPSAQWLANGDDKAAVLQAYKDKLGCVHACGQPQCAHC